jgi:deoxyadenosine/deoxycytidine kinase
MFLPEYEEIVPRIISFEGNIGSGKTTLVKKLKERYANQPDILFLEEPVDVWERIKQDGKTILQLFYDNPRKYSFAFQILAYRTRSNLIQEALASNPGVKLILMERSLEADNEIFAKMLFEEGLMESCEYDIYKTITNNEYSVDGIVWLRTKPEVCLERVQTRGREGEENMSLDYLAKCDVYHKQWLADLGFVFQMEEVDEKELQRLDNYLRM